MLESVVPSGYQAPLGGGSKYRDLGLGGAALSGEGNKQAQRY
jgi:hypothetical protein